MSKQSRGQQVASYSASAVTYADGEDASLQVDSSGGLIMGQPSTAALNTPYRSPNAGWNSLVVLIASGAKQISGVNLINLNTAPAYLDIFDQTAAVTLGTTVPTATIPIGANVTPANGSGVVANDLAMKITSGKVSIAVVTASGGATPVTTGVVGTIWAR